MPGDGCFRGQKRTRRLSLLLQVWEAFKKVEANSGSGWTVWMKRSAFPLVLGV
jgi:hypothetical protein